MDKIGFIGLGIMGRPMAKNLIKAGYAVVVCDVNQQAVEELRACGAESAATPAETAEKAGTFIVTMLPNSPQVREVTAGENGLLKGIRAGQIVVDMSSISPIASRELDALLREKGAEMLDAPVSGGQEKAEQGTLAIMVGGSAAAFEKDGSQYLLYTATWADQGFSDGEAGVVRLVDGDFTWVWPVEGDVRDSRSQAYEDYHDYWEGKKPLMAPGGVEIFTENQDYGIYEGSPVQWVPAQNEVFWLTDEEDLPTGVYDQSRAWLEQFTRAAHNPWDARNTSALWQIVSLAPADGEGRDRNDAGEAVYELKARADNGEDLWFAASLLFDHSGEHPIQVQRWNVGTRAEIDRGQRVERITATCMDN